MIIVELAGGLGNQMFQYAAGRTLALKHDTDLKLSLSLLRDDKLRKYELLNFNIVENFATDKEVQQLTRLAPGSLRFYLHKMSKILNRHTGLNLQRVLAPALIEEKTMNYDPSVIDSGENTVLSGYWQSEKYFLPIRASLLNDFTLKFPIHRSANETLNQIEATESVAIHVRRGDYVSNPDTAQTHGTCSLEYYSAAFKYLSERLTKPIFFIFSDDIGWCRSHLNFGSNTFYVEHHGHARACDDLFLMSQCRHNVIANSSYSWWSAWLNKNIDKMIIAPRLWFKDESRCSADLIPSGWIRI